MTSHTDNGYDSNHISVRDGYYARNECSSLQMREMQSHMGTTVDKEPQDVPEVQEPLLEHAKNAGKEELGG